MMEEELIEAVRNEQCLFDPKHPDYVRIKLKDSIWKDIAEALNLKDGNEAKKAWEKLRNNHRDALRRQKNFKPKSGPGAVNIKSWRFQDHMAFLIPYMSIRTNHTNLCAEKQDDELSQAHSDNPDIDIQENLVDNQELQTTAEDTNQLPESLPLSTSTLQKRRRYNNIGNTLNELLNRSIDKHLERVNRERLISNTTNDFMISNVKNDPLFHFFISMYETTKRLPPLSQHSIKTNIFAIVSGEESEHLIQYSPHLQSSSTHISNTGKYYEQ